MSVGVIRDQRYNWDMYTPHIYYVARGTGTPKKRDDVKSREVWECDGWVYDLEVIGAPSIFKFTRKTAALSRMFPTLDLICEENTERRRERLITEELLKLQEIG